MVKHPSTLFSHLEVFLQAFVVGCLVHGAGSQRYQTGGEDQFQVGELMDRVTIFVRGGGVMYFEAVVCLAFKVAQALPFKNTYTGNFQFLPRAQAVCRGYLRGFVVHIVAAFASSQ